MAGSVALCLLQDEMDAGMSVGAGSVIWYPLQDEM